MVSFVGEAVIGGMTDAAVGSLLSKLSQEVSRIHAFQGDVEALKRQLTILQGFVRSAYYSHNRMERHVLEWVENVEDYIFQAERILNDCSWWHDSASSSSCLNKVLKCPQNVWSKWRNSRRISRISKELRLMVNLAIQSGLKRQCDEHPPTLTEESEVKTRSILYEESFTVGLDEKLSKFHTLMKDHPRIGVVGMGGVGKTRLLQHVFKHAKSRYDPSIWLCVSQIYDIKSLQMNILHEVLRDNSELEALGRVSSDRRAEKIHEALKVKTCLIVLDDVWSSDPTRRQGSLPEIDLLKALGLPENVKLLVSTRNSQVVTDLKAYPYQMELLSTEDSKKLFCLYAFGSADFHEPQQDRLLKIIETCHNLPLALKTTARALACQYHGNPATFALPEEEADDCEHSFGNTESDRRVMWCLKRSYNVLPMHLKPCFAYMAVFPEDHEIDGSKLVKLWMAEGFVSSPRSGRNVVSQLCDRCLLEVVPTDRDDWEEPIKYKMHDLIRHLAILIFHSVGGFCRGSMDDLRKALMRNRRVSGGGVSDKFTFDAGGSQLCSLFVYSRQVIFHTLWEMAEHLRVLHTNNSSVQCPGKALKHLVYLYMKKTDSLDWLRDSRSLEYLYIKTRERLPHWIGDLSRLAYFELSHSISDDSYVSAQKSLGRLVDLRELKRVLIDHRFTFRHLSSLQKLMELRCATELPLASVEEWTPPPSMQCLWFNNLKGQFNMPESWKVMTNIQCLRLERVSMTSGYQDFQKLVHLVLENCSGNPPIEIAKLPSLTALRLQGFVSCSELPEEYGMLEAFPSLKHFVIARFPLLRQLPSIEKGAMKSLRTLVVIECRNLNENELPMELSTRLSSQHVQGGRMWQLKVNMSTEVPLQSYYVDCGRHSFGGLCSV